MLALCHADLAADNVTPALDVSVQSDPVTLLQATFNGSASATGAGRLVAWSELQQPPAPLQVAATGTGAFDYLFQ